MPSFLRLREGWLTVGLLALMLFSVTLSIQQAQWVDGLSILTPVTILGLGAGGSDPQKFWAANSPQNRGSIKGGCQEKTIPLPQGEERFSDIELPPKIAR